MSEPRDPLTPEYVHKVLRCVVGLPSDLFEDAERLCLEWLAQREAIAHLTAERDAYASEALVAISGSGVNTPAAGYVKDGGPSQMAADIRRLRRVKNAWLQECNDAMARRISRLESELKACEHKPVK
jgi:hypothetical protein